MRYIHHASTPDETTDEEYVWMYNLYKIVNEMKALGIDNVLCCNLIKYYKIDEVGLNFNSNYL